MLNLEVNEVTTNHSIQQFRKSNKRSAGVTCPPPCDQLLLFIQTWCTIRRRHTTVTKCLGTEVFRNATHRLVSAFVLPLRSGLDPPTLDTRVPSSIETSVSTASRRCRNVPSRTNRMYVLYIPDSHGCPPRGPRPGR